MSRYHTTSEFTVVADGALRNLSALCAYIPGPQIHQSSFTHVQTLHVLVEDDDGCRPVEVLRKESLAGLAPSAACRVLSHAYAAVVPITPLPYPPLPLNPNTPGQSCSTFVSYVGCTVYTCSSADICLHVCCACIAVQSSCGSRSSWQARLVLPLRDDASLSCNTLRGRATILVIRALRIS